MNLPRPNKSSTGEVLLSPNRMQRSPQRRSDPAADVAGGCPPPSRGSCAATWTPTHTKSHVIILTVVTSSILTSIAIQTCHTCLGRAWYIPAIRTSAMVLGPPRGMERDTRTGVRLRRGEHPWVSQQQVPPRGSLGMQDHGKHEHLAAAVLQTQQEHHQQRQGPHRRHITDNIHAIATRPPAASDSFTEPLHARHFRSHVRDERRSSERVDALLSLTMVVDTEYLQ